MEWRPCGSMLNGAGLEKKLWEETISIACYLINRYPMSTLVDKTPMEVWMAKKSSLQHLYVFGCEENSHVIKEKWFKLDNKVVKCIFISYGFRVKEYKLWDPTIGKFSYRRNVIFQEVEPSPIVV